MRWVAYAMFLWLPACASRSTLHGNEPDALAIDTAIDTAPETYGRDVAAGPTCADREWMCPLDDFGPLKTVQAVYEECTKSTGAACGDLRLVFDNDGCLITIDEIHSYSTAFVDCVERIASAKRWQCANGGGAFHMYQSCGP